MPVTHLMSAQVSPLALIIPRPQIPSAIPHLYTSSFISSVPRTPSRSPVASHIFISPPTPNRNSTDSWNSSNYDFDDPTLQWKEDEVRLLGRTLDALPAHLITPFNGSIPPPNLLDKISRGILAAKGPNDWPHSVTATRAKLLELARARAQEERRKSVIDEDFIFLSSNDCYATMPVEPDKGGELKDGTLDPADVLQSTTNTPARRRHTLHRQSSMDFMADAKADHKESISRLSHRLQRHEHTFHHPYLRPPHLRRAAEYSLSPSTPSSSTLNTSRQSHFRKSTASSSSNSTFGSPVSAPLRPSSLRRSSTLTLESSCDIRMDADAENISKIPEFQRSDGYAESATVGAKVKKTPAHDLKVSSSRTSSAKKVKTPTNTKDKTKIHALSVTSPPKTPQSKPPVLPITTIKMASSIKQPKFRKGHMPSLSISSDEEENARSKRAKKPRTREPSSRIASPDLMAQRPLLASSQIADPTRRVKPHELNQSRRSAASAFKSASSSSDNDNEFSTASVETAATSVSLTTPAAPKRQSGVQVQKEESKSKPVRRNPVRNPSMFGPELPCPQATPAPPSRIPLSSPIYTACPSPPPSPSTLSTPPLSRPRTLRHAARRISFGSLANARATSPIQGGESSTLALGSAFQLA